MIEVREWLDPQARSPFGAWLDGLDPSAAAKVHGALDRMRLGNLGDHKAVGGGVWERRIDWGPGLRIYFGRKGAEIVVLLGGGDKKTQSRDIIRAREVWSWNR
jgi:putative addiction module killer protein